MAQKNFFVIYIITKLELGGAQKICLSLFEYFVKNDKALLITGQGGTLDRKAEKIGPVIFLKTLINSVSPKAFYKDLISFIKIFKIVKKSLKEHENVLVHTHSSKAGIIGRFAARIAGCKNIIHTIHGFSFNPYQNPIKYWLFWISEFLANIVSSKLIFVSKIDMDYAISKMLVPAHKCTVIRAFPSHVPETSYKKTKSNISKITIGTVSCFKEQKNLFDLLEAFKTICQRAARKRSKVQVNLEIVGDGNLRAKIKSWINQAKLETRIKLHGWLDNLEPFFSKIDIFSLSSLWEGLPCAVIEAKLFKLPVVLYNVGGSKEVIENGLNGFLIKPGDRKSLSDYLELLANNQRLRLKIGQLGYDFAEFERLYTMALHKKLYLDLIE